MTSIIKVDQIQDSGGNTVITSDGSGNLTAGTFSNITKGAIIQVVEASLNRLSTSSTSYASIGTLAITPESSSNKILVMILNHIYVSSHATDTWRGALIKVLRDSTIILQEGTGGGYGEGAYLVGNSDRYMCYSHIHKLDNPGTTNEITYDVQFGSKTTSPIDINNNNYGSGGRITLMEIAG